MKIATICFPRQGDSIYLSNKKRGFGEGFLNGYGGKKQEDETLLQAVVREFGEEAGATITEGDVEEVGVINFYKGDTPLFECHVFYVNSWQGELLETEEMAKPELFSLDNLPYDRMWSSDVVWLSPILKGEKIRATIKYNEAMDMVESFEYVSLD